MIRTLLAADAIRAREQVLRDLAHDDELRAVAQHLVDDRGLIRRRALEHRVQRHDHGHAQRADEIEDVAAVVAAEDAVLVLHRDQAHGTVVHELRGARVIGFHVLPNLELHVRRVLVLARRLGDGEHHGQRALVGPGDGRGEIGRERCDAAAARTVRADERDRELAIRRLARALGARVLVRVRVQCVVRDKVECHGGSNKNGLWSVMDYGPRFRAVEHLVRVGGKTAARFGRSVRRQRCGRHARVVRQQPIGFLLDHVIAFARQLFELRPVEYRDLAADVAYDS